MVFAVDPVETISTPAAVRPWASSMSPVLSYTLINARRIGLFAISRQSSVLILCSSVAFRPIVAFRPTRVRPPVAIAATTSTRQLPFGDFDAFVQSLFGVAVEHRNGLLRQYRPGVRPGIYQVHRTACDLHAVGQRVGHSVRTRETPAAAPDEY